MMGSLVALVFALAVQGMAHASFDNRLCPLNFSFTAHVSGVAVPDPVDGKLFIEASRVVPSEAEARLPNLCQFKGKDSRGNNYDLSVWVRTENLQKPSPFVVEMRVQRWLTEDDKFYFNTPKFFLSEGRPGERYQFLDKLDFFVEPKHWYGGPDPRYCPPGVYREDCIPIML